MNPPNERENAVPSLGGQVFPRGPCSRSDSRIIRVDHDDARRTLLRVMVFLRMGGFCLSPGHNEQCFDQINSFQLPIGASYPYDTYTKLN